MNDTVSTHIDDYKYRPQHAWHGIAHEDDARYYTDGCVLLKRSLFPRPLKRMLVSLKSDWRTLRHRRVGNKMMDRIWNCADLGDRVRGTLSDTVETRQDYRKDSTITVTHGDRVVILDADTVKFIMTRCKDVSFWITGNTGGHVTYDSVVIKTGRKKLGVIMPRTA